MYFSKFYERMIGTVKVKKMKKWVASALVLVYTFGINMLPTDYADRNYVYAAEKKQSYTQDFDGEMPALTEGGSASADGGYLGSYTTEERDTGGYYLKVDGTSLGNNTNYVVKIPIDVTMDLNDETYAEIVWEFDLMLGSMDGKFDTTYRPYFHLAKGDSLMTGFRFNNGWQCCDNLNKTGRYSEATIGWQHGKWHRVKMVYNPKTTTYDAWIDGVKKGS